MKLKRALRRIISLMLLVTMLLPTTINAEENKGNGGGTDSSGTIGTGSDKGDNCSLG